MPTLRPSQAVAWLKQDYRTLPAAAHCYTRLPAGFVAGSETEHPTPINGRPGDNREAVPGAAIAGAKLRSQESNTTRAPCLVTPGQRSAEGRPSTNCIARRDRPQVRNHVTSGAARGDVSGAVASRMAVDRDHATLPERSPAKRPATRARPHEPHTDSYAVPFS